MSVNYIAKIFGSKIDSDKVAGSFGQKHKPKVLTAHRENEKKIEHIISNSDLVNTGQVQLLGLGVLKNDLGDKWPDLRERVLDSLHKIISERVGVNDVYFSRSDEEHIIVFSNRSDKAARFICAKILQELSELYLGSVDMSSITVNTAVGRVDGKLLFESASLDDLFQEVTSRDLSLKKQVGADQRKPPSSSKGIPYEVVYKPIWDVKHEAITTYMVNTKSVNRYRHIKMGYDVLADPHCPEAMVEMDHTILRETIEMMDELFLNNFRAIFAVPVCYETLFNSDRSKDYLSSCKKIPSSLRKYISFTLIGFPFGVPPTKLRFIGASLLKYGRSVVITCPEIPHNIFYYNDCDIKVISLAASKNTMNPSQYWQQLALLAAKCKNNKIIMSLEEINQPDDLIVAREIGVNFVSGDIIGPYVDIPGHMSRMTWKDLVGA